MKRSGWRMFPAFTVTVVLLLSACGTGGGGPLSSAQSDALNWEVQDFNFTNQDGESVSLEDLKGDVWLANFIFTNCRTVCPPMTANMAQIQQAMKEEGLNIPIVSFSVDPENDSPEALKEYGGNVGADFTNWHFLTGYEFEDIQQLSQESFKALVEPEPDSDQIMHGTSFYLVNQSGSVVQKYNGLEPPVEEIIDDIKALR